MKVLTRSDPVPPMEIVFFRGCFQFAGCCGLLGLYPPMCRAPSRWFGDSCKEMRWLGLRGLVGFGGIAFSFQAVSLLGIAEVQVVQTSTPVLAAIYARVIARRAVAADRNNVRRRQASHSGVALQFGGHQQTHGSDHAAGLAFALAARRPRAASTSSCAIWDCGESRLAHPDALPGLRADAPPFPAHVALRGGAIRTVFSSGQYCYYSRAARWASSCNTDDAGHAAVKSASASIARLSGLPWSFCSRPVHLGPRRGRTSRASCVASMGFVVHAARLQNTAPQAKVLVELPTYAKVSADDDDEHGESIETTARFFVVRLRKRFLRAFLPAWAARTGG